MEGVRCAFRAIGHTIRTIQGKCDFQQNQNRNPSIPMAVQPLTRSPGVSVQASDVVLEGSLTTAEQPVGIVIFAHGSGSSRFSPRNQFVAGVLNEGGLSTLLFDLLTPAENAIDQRTGALRFDIHLLAKRLTGAVDWIHSQSQFAELPIGLFGASTGAAAALMTAAARPEWIAAVVSRGGRPDLAGSSLGRVRAPTLLIVGGDDRQVIALNQQAAQAMKSPLSMQVIPHATHLFEEPGTLETAAKSARDWFLGHCKRPVSSSPETPQ
jgi:dienelactone hydrolase